MNYDYEYEPVIGVLTYENDANLVGDGRGPSQPLEVLQLGLRRKMLKAVLRSCISLSQIEREFDLSPAQAEYHLRMLEKALVVEQTAGGWIATPTGILYMENVETKR